MRWGFRVMAPDGVPAKAAEPQSLYRIFDLVGFCTNVACSVQPSMFVILQPPYLTQVTQGSSCSKACAAQS